MSPTAAAGTLPARTVQVRWDGGTGRSGPVTMGQANMIRCMLRDDPAQINIHAVWPVPAGVAQDEVVDALRALVLRHEALRTTFPAPDEQIVAPDGAFGLEVRDHGAADGEPAGLAGLAELVAQDARSDRFHLDRDFPLRVTLMTHDGVPRHLALAASHAAVDAGALVVLRDEWTALLAGDGQPGGPAVAPIDIAVDERSPAGQRRSAAALRHWERVLRTAPQEMFAEPRESSATAGAPVDVATPELSIHSLRAGRALAAAAARTGSPAQTVLLAAWCVLVGHRAGQRSCVVATPTANRHSSALAHAVTPLSQDALLRLDLGDDGFDAVLRRTWGAALDAYRHSRFDSARLWDLIEQVTHERGSRFARDVVLNDVSSMTGTPDDEAHPELELGWGPEQDLPTSALTFVHAVEPALRMSVRLDPRLFDRREAEGLVLGLVRLLEAVALADVPCDRLADVTGVRTLDRGEEWRQVDGCWVHLPTATATVTKAVTKALADGRGSGPRPLVHVTVDDSRITAYVAGIGAACTVRQVHRAVMDVVPGRPGTLAPHRYVIVTDPPERPHDTDAWRALPVIDEGSGRDPAVTA